MREPSTDLDDQLEGLEPPYESPAHRQIGRALDRYGIPFFYRQPTLVYDGGSHHVYHPVFTLPGYNGLVIEYARAGQPDGDAHLRHRRDVHELNQIPAVFVSPDDMKKLDWQAGLVERVAEAGGPPYGGDPTPYSAMPAKVYHGHPHVGGGYR